MSIHIGFLLNTAILVAAFFGGRFWAKTNSDQYGIRRAGVTPGQRQLELFRVKQAGRVIQYGSALIWLVIAAAYLAINFKIFSE